MSVIERIEEQLASQPVVLYMKGTPDFPQCGFSGRVVQVLQACNAQYRAINIFEDPELRDALKAYSNWPTYPQLYVNGQLVGGCDIVMDLFNKGELQSMIGAA
ncbi:MAG: Grx4 family monothiol glutaredoxin [Methylomonas sp.]|jgi:monothiol glutaredoxin|uniref:Grx4 family monothiol glutaredoxin n=1 Tax=Methylomonas sp. TaxID=418 RepID=UPI0025E7707A|nr:Grx4 family monothiol glutaredoxin [Methylomonas sp.]MCK9608596.1 Grx4 family monothiol glutaredoxin [Methylomonas sp.]